MLYRTVARAGVAMEGERREPQVAASPLLLRHKGCWKDCWSHFLGPYTVALTHEKLLSQTPRKAGAVM